MIWFCSYGVLGLGIVDRTGCMRRGVCWHWLLLHGFHGVFRRVRLEKWPILETGERGYSTYWYQRPGISQVPLNTRDLNSNSSTPIQNETVSPPFPSCPSSYLPSRLGHHQFPRQQHQSQRQLEQALVPFHHYPKHSPVEVCWSLRT